MDREGTNGIVNLKLIEQQDGKGHKDTGDETDDDRHPVGHAVAASGDAHKAAEDTIEAHREVRFAEHEPAKQRGTQSTRSSSKRRGHGDVHGCVDVACSMESQLAARIKAEPTEPENKDAKSSERQTVARHRHAFFR